MIATEEHVPMIVRLGKEMHERSVWKDFVPFNSQDFEDSCRNLMGRDDASVFVSEEGVLMIFKSDLYFNRAQTIAAELFFYAPKGGDMLRREAEKWAGGLIAMNRHATTDPRLEKIYARAGYVPIETTYVRA